MADLAIINAHILTMDPRNPTAQALAVEDGKICAVGDQAGIVALCSAETRVIDAQGATVLPGFVESHMHLFIGAHSRTVLNLSDAHGTAAIATAIQDFASANPDAPLLIGQGFHYDSFDGDRDPTRHDLDAICPDRPLLLQSADFHNGWANTTALTAAGIMHGRDAGPASEVVLGADGLATGVLTEPPAVATVLTLGAHGGREGLGLEGVEPAIPPTPAQRDADKALLRDGLAHCAAQGITSIINMDGNLYQAELLSEIEAEGDLICRLELPYHFTPGEPDESIEIAEKMRRDLNSDMLWCNRIKMFMDGVLDMETAYRLNDYPGSPGHRSEPMHAPERFNELAVEFDRRGFQIAVHAIGDAAVRTVLDGYQAARDRNGPRDSRHRIEHIELIDPADIPRLAKLKVIASLQPPHPPGCEFPLEPTATKIVGRDEWPNAFLWRSLADAGAKICFASDWAVASLEPLLGINYAMTREPWAEELPDERLSFEQTLHAYTAGGAFAALKDQEFGQLVPGLAADIVVLDRVLMPDKAAEAQVTTTICNGRVTYDAN